MAFVIFSEEKLFSYVGKNRTKFEQGVTNQVTGGPNVTAKIVKVSDWKLGMLKPSKLTLIYAHMHVQVFIYIYFLYIQPPPGLESPGWASVSSSESIQQLSMEESVNCSDRAFGVCPST